jgi:hypothetical protein
MLQLRLERGFRGKEGQGISVVIASKYMFIKRLVPLVGHRRERVDGNQRACIASLPDWRFVMWTD